MSEEIEVIEPVAIEQSQAKVKENLDFANDVLKLSLGTAFVQVENFLVSMIFTRIFLPEHYGISILFSSITGILAVVVFFRYEAAVMLPKTKEEGANLFIASLVIGVLFSLGMLPVVYFGRGWISGLLKAPELEPYLWLVPLGTFLTGLTTLLGYWNSRSRHYLRQATNRMVNQVVADGTRFGFAFADRISGGSMIFSVLSGQFISNLQLFIRTWRDDRQVFLQDVSVKQMLAGLKRYKKFPLFTSWAALLNTASTQMPSFLLAAFFSTEVTGFYGVGQRVLRLPITLIGGAIGQVFYQRAAKARHEGGLARLVEETFNTLIIFGTFPMLLLTIAGREIFAVFFGPTWAEAGVYSQILGPWTFFLFLSSPLSTLTNLHEKQEISLLLNIFLFVTRVVSLVIGGLLHNIYLGLQLFTLSGVLAYGWFSLWATSASGVPIRTTLRQLGANLLFSAPFLGAVAATKWVFHLSPVLVVAISALAGLLYYVGILMRNPDLKISLQGIIQRYRERFHLNKAPRP